jgi:tape measure domain-containing protein
VPTIRASMELFDNFSQKMDMVNRAAEQGIAIMSRLQSTMQTNVKLNVDTSGLEALQPTVDPAIQQEQLNAAMMKTKILEEQLRKATANTEAAREKAKATAQQTVLIEEKLRAAVNQTVAANERVKEAVERTKIAEEKLKHAIEANRQQQERFNQSVHSGKGEVDSLASSVMAIAGAYLSINSAVDFVGYADQLLSTNTRLALVNDGLRTQAELQRQVMDAANRTRGSYEATADMVAKLGMFTDGIFKDNDGMLSFAERFNKVLVAGGAGTVERDIATLQMSQALASGRLQGDELRSISEAAPLLLKVLADGMGVARGELKQLGADGELTAEVIVKAFEKQGQAIDDLFEKMPMTSGQAVTLMKTQFAEWVSSLMVVDGPLQKVTDTIERLAAWMDTADGKEFFNELAQGIAIIANGFSFAADLIMNNMDAVQAVLIATGIVLAALGVQWLATWAVAAWPVLAVIGAIAGLLFILDKLGISAGDVIGYVTGIFYGWFAFVWNNIAYLYNAFLAFAEFFANVFIDPEYAVRKLFYDLTKNVVDYFSNMINAIIGGLNWLIAKINEISGKDISLIASVDASAIEKLKPKTDAAVFDFSKYRMEMKDLTASFATGYNKGAGVFDRAAAALSNIEGLGMGGSDTLKRVDEVGKINDTVDISSEDLKVMRDLAEMKSIQNFVTLTPTVNVTTGPIAKEVDVDEVIRRIGDTMEQEIESSADGVYGDN